MLPAPAGAEMLFDNGARDLLRLQSPGARDAADTFSDIFVYSIAAYPIVADALIESWAIRGNRRQAEELTRTAAQALFLTAVARLVVRTAVPRLRPYAKDCDANSDYIKDCDSSEREMSFFSGHAAFAFTGAGLICHARERFELAGGNTACWVGIGAATAVALSRVMADRHYLTDVMAGAAVGITLGYLIPRFIQDSVIAFPIISKQGAGAAVSVRL